MTSEDPDITLILKQLHAGDSEAKNELLNFLYEDLHLRAERAMRGQPSDHTLQSTALVNEAYIRLIGPRKEPWADRVHFLSVAATAMRQILVDHARHKGRAKRDPGGSRLPLEGVLVEFEERAYDLEALDQALVNLEGFDSLMARSVELRFFAGMTVAETCKELDLSERSFERRWRATKAWLLAQIMPPS